MLLVTWWVTPSAASLPLSTIQSPMGLGAEGGFADCCSWRQPYRVANFAIFLPEAFLGDYRVADSGVAGAGIACQFVTPKTSRRSARGVWLPMA